MKYWRLAMALTIAAFAFGPREAEAVPSFSEQTAQPCTACHIGGFGPELTPFGRAFKMGGYTIRASEDVLPISAMAVASYVHTSADQTGPPAPHYASNDNVALDEASLFLAGGIGTHFGGFVQGTFDGIGRAFSWDNMDLRAVTTARIGMSSAVLGLSLNNNPSVQDPWNTLPAWGFPFTGSDLTPSPAAAPLISDSLGGNVLGISAYAWWDSSLYAGVGLYRSLGPRFLRAAGVDPADTSLIDGVAPYARFAYEHDFGEQNLQLGAFGLFADLYPGRDKSARTTDSYSDLGLDASYQFMGTGENIYSMNAVYTHESQRLAASDFFGDATNAHNTLEDVRIRGTYYWKNMVGGTVGVFRTWGSPDALLYADSRTLKPDSAGYLLQIDYTPFGGGDGPFGSRFNLRLGLQYTIFTEFDGSGRDYDGSGRNASDNNTLRLFTWLAF